ncbi:MAG: coproporphyrinogen dehydrogenase HemZ, partial [Ruminococcus sp.]|nr:coproporphyrinogen dehydrogenase HemZ [Ruminococcus sp.]
LRAASMLDYAFKKLVDEKYLPYYLYRQTRMVGNLENTGWSKRGMESLYNIYVMDETHTILGCGAGAVTKLKKPRDTYLERIFNFKYPYEYIDRFNTLIERKEQIYTFYEKYF